jgi:hypothetical protein
MGSDHHPDSWLQPVADLIAERQRRGGILLALPDYRPDLARAVADGLGLSYFDVRAEILMPLGWDAAKVGVDELTEILAERADDTDILAHNVEALLSTKDEAARQGWIEQFLDRDWPHLVVVPLFLFIHEAPAASPRMLHLAAEDLPPETLLGQFRFWGG